MESTELLYGDSSQLILHYFSTFLLDTEGSGQLVNERNGGDGVPDGATPSPGPHRLPPSLTALRAPGLVGGDTGGSRPDRLEAVGRHHVAVGTDDVDLVSVDSVGVDTVGSVLHNIFRNQWRRIEAIWALVSGNRKLFGVLVIFPGALSLAHKISWIYDFSDVLVTQRISF